jgi:GH15 family glucan-1,4-alpha-glucosidase
MSTPIEDYGIIGNTYTAALVSREGSIDWLCLPRFDSESVFAALLGGAEHGRWLIVPADRLVRLSRCYRGETGILETHFKRNTFVQYYGARDLDASLLLIPQVGFLPPEDPRVRGTIEAIERELLQDGFVCRYPSRPGADGLPPGEGVFLACSFWLANSLALIGRRDDAIALFERLLALRNDLGLLAEEYDPGAKRQLGNFPQAFSHTAIINTAAHLAELETASGARQQPTAGPATQRERD